MSAPVLTFAGVTKDFRLGWRNYRVRAIDDFSLTVGSGHIFGLLGPNGSGKSSVLKIAAGLILPDSGVCEVKGEAANRRGPAVRIGFQPENGGVYHHLSARESLEWFGGISGLPKLVARKQARDLLAQFELIESADRQVGSFSKGMRQRLGIAQALVHRPEILLLDEPFSGLDPLAVRGLIAILRRLSGEGVAMLLTSHLLGRVEDLCDSVGLLHRGRLLIQGTLAEVKGGAGRQMDDVFIQHMESAGGEASCSYEGGR